MTLISLEKFTLMTFSVDKHKLQNKHSLIVVQGFFTYSKCCESVGMNMVWFKYSLKLNMRMCVRFFGINWQHK